MAGRTDLPEDIAHELIAGKARYRKRKKLVYDSPDMPELESMYKVKEAVYDPRTVYCDQLRQDGVTVIPFLAPSSLGAMRDRFDDECVNFPEFHMRPSCGTYVLGGFAAFGNPGSFHNEFVRRVRSWAM